MKTIAQSFNWIHRDKQTTW